MHWMILQQQRIQTVLFSRHVCFFPLQRETEAKSQFGYYLGPAHSQPFENCNTFNIKVLTYIT